MQTIEFTSYLKQGQITVPSSFHLAEGQAVKVIILLDDVAEQDKSIPESIWQKTAGGWQGEALCREPQGDFEQRLELE
jgi:hypothetical protein